MNGPPTSHTSYPSNHNPKPSFFEGKGILVNSFFHHALKECTYLTGKHSHSIWSLQIFVNIYLRKMNEAPVMMIPVKIVKRTLRYTPTSKKRSLLDDIFSLFLLQTFKLLLHFLFSPFPTSFYGFVSLYDTL